MNFYKNRILITLVTGFLLNTASHAYQISDHSLKGSKIKTYHVKCNTNTIALIRINKKENSVCIDHQNNNKPKQCLKMSTQSIQHAIDQLAQQVCK